MALSEISLGRIYCWRWIAITQDARTTHASTNNLIWLARRVIQIYAHTNCSRASVSYIFIPGARLGVWCSSIQASATNFHHPKTHLLPLQLVGLLILSPTTVRAKHFDNSFTQRTIDDGPHSSADECNALQCFPFPRSSSSSSIFFFSCSLCLFLHSTTAVVAVVCWLLAFPTRNCQTVEKNEKKRANFSLEYDKHNLKLNYIHSAIPLSSFGFFFSLSFVHFFFALVYTAFNFFISTWVLREWAIKKIYFNAWMNFLTWMKFDNICFFYGWHLSQVEQKTCLSTDDVAVAVWTLMQPPIPIKHDILLHYNDNFFPSVRGKWLLYIWMGAHKEGPFISFWGWLMNMHAKILNIFGCDSGRFLLRHAPISRQDSNGSQMYCQHYTIL